MPAFVCKATATVVQVGDSPRVVQFIIQNASVVPVRIYSLEACCGNLVPTLVLTRYDQAATLTPLGPSRPVIYSPDFPGASPNFIVATLETDTIAPNGSADLDDLVLYEVSEGHIALPEAILLNPDSSLTVSTVVQVGARAVSLHVQAKEET